MYSSTHRATLEHREGCSSRVRRNASMKASTLEATVMCHKGMTSVRDAEHARPIDALGLRL